MAKMFGRLSDGLFTLWPETSDKWRTGGQTYSDRYRHTDRQKWTGSDRQRVDTLWIYERSRTDVNRTNYNGSIR